MTLVGCASELRGQLWPLVTVLDGYQKREETEGNVDSHARSYGAVSVCHGWN